MKKLLSVLLFVVATGGMCSMAHSAFLGSDPLAKTKVIVDTDIIKTFVLNDKQWLKSSRVTIMFDNPTIIDSKTKQLVISQTDYSAIDCKNNKMIIFRTDNLDKNNHILSSNKISEKDALDWKSPPPNSMYSAQVEYVCSIGSETI